MNIISKLDGHNKNGAQVNITWYYEPEDEDMLEFGEELQDGTDIKIKLKEYKL